MYKLITALAASAIALLAGCESTSDIPESSISLQNRTSGQIISTASNTGELTLAVGEVYRFKVERLQASSDDTQTSDVTTVSSYHFTPEGIASANTLGELRGLTPGTTQLEVRFRPDNFGSADRVYLDITVIP